MKTNGGSLALLALVLGCAPAPKLPAQNVAPWPAANLLEVAVSPTVEIAGADTLVVRYSLSSLPGSRQAADAFVIRAFVPLTVRSPRLWRGGVAMVQESLAVHWFGAVEAFVQPGATLEGFETRGVGVLDVVGFRVEGYYNLPASDEANDRTPAVGRPPSLWANSAPGLTVGIVPPPVGATPGSLTVRIESLETRACDLGWISNHGICNSLSVKLEHAQRSIDRGQLEGARGDLQAFLHELEAQRGKHVNDNAYWLLKSSAELVLARL